MANYVLSKSTYIRSRQCLKSLYLHKFYPAFRDPLSPQQAAVFKRGHKVGALARKLFPGGTDVTPTRKFDFDSAITQTKSLLRSQNKNIYEATFLADEILIMLDILQIEGGKYHAIEVKSSSSVSETYIEDASLQYYVMSKAGYTPDSFSILYLNRHYRFKGSLNISELYNRVDITELCIAKQDAVEKQVQRAKNSLNAGAVPPIPTGEHCFTPYLCDFSRHCHVKLAVKEQTATVIDHTLRFALASAIFMRYAIPFLENCRPYEAIPVAWTIVEDGDIRQKFFQKNQNPREEFMEAIKSLESKYDGILTNDIANFSKFTELELFNFSPDYNSLSIASEAEARVIYEELSSTDDMFRQHELQETLKNHTMQIIEQMKQVTLNE